MLFILDSSAPAAMRPAMLGFVRSATMVEEIVRFGMPVLAIIHTTVAGVEGLRKAAAELLPSWQLINFVDDSILPELQREGGDPESVRRRLLLYVEFAEEAGADVVLEACSSVGEIVAEARRRASIPVVRIDDAIAELAVQQGGVITAVATLPTALRPTARLLAEKAAAAGKSIEVKRVLVADAYQKLLVGDAVGHDQCVVNTLGPAAAASDVVVLAQASMARVLPSLAPDVAAKCFTSPRLAMEQVRSIWEKRT